MGKGWRMHGLKLVPRGRADLGEPARGKGATTLAVHSFSAQRHGSIVFGFGSVGRGGVATLHRVICPQRRSFFCLPAGEPIECVGSCRPFVGLGTLGKRDTQHTFWKQQELSPGCYGIVKSYHGKTSGEHNGPPPTSPMRNVTKRGPARSEDVVKSREQRGVLGRGCRGRDSLARWRLGGPVPGPASGMNASAGSNDKTTNAAAGLVVTS